jgi:hypothetical protein
MLWTQNQCNGVEHHAAHHTDSARNTTEQLGAKRVAFCLVERSSP